MNGKILLDSSLKIVNEIIYYVDFDNAELYLKWKPKKDVDSSWTTIYMENDETFYTLTNLTCGITYKIVLGYYDYGIQEHFTTKPIEATTLKQGLPLLTQEDILVALNSTSAVLRFDPWLYSNCPASSVSIEMKEKTETHWNLLYFTHTPVQVSFFPCLFFLSPSN